MGPFSEHPVKRGNYRLYAREYDGAGPPSDRGRFPVFELNHLLSLDTHSLSRLSLSRPVFPGTIQVLQATSVSIGKGRQIG